MKTIKLVTSLLLIVFITTFMLSCKGDDGADGVDGAQGIAGQDGNANAQTYIYNNPQWDDFGAGMHIDMTGILTDDVIKNDAVLVYIKHSTNNFVFSIPGAVWAGNYRNYAVLLIESSILENPNSLELISLEMDGTFTPNSNLWDVSWVRVVIIKTTDTTTDPGAKIANPKQRVLSHLEQEGIDVNDYRAVCQYYGLNPEY